MRILASRSSRETPCQCIALGTDSVCFGNRIYRRSETDRPKQRFFRTCFPFANVSEVTFHEVRAHLGVETQRQWSDLAILRITPVLLRPLFSGGSLCLIACR